jgi:hypothetical protein
MVKWLAGGCFEEASNETSGISTTFAICEQRDYGLYHLGTGRHDWVLVPNACERLFTTPPVGRPSHSRLNSLVWGKAPRWRQVGCGRQRLGAPTLAHLPQT